MVGGGDSGGNCCGQSDDVMTLRCSKSGREKGKKKENKKLFNNFQKALELGCSKNTLLVDIEVYSKYIRNKFIKAIRKGLLTKCKRKNQNNFVVFSLTTDTLI